MLKKLDKFLISLTYFYLLLPIILFALGWLKPWLAIIITTLLIYSGVKAAKGFAGADDDCPVKITTLKVLMALLLILAIIYWVYLSGIGGFMFQNEDFELRNAMLRDLIDFNWPVKYNYPAEPAIHDLAGDQGALVYYFIYWLPAALIGKLSGWAGANIFLFTWTVLGVLICFYWFLRNFKKLSAILLLLFIFWSGLDAVGWMERGNHLSLGMHLEWWASVFQYSSNTTVLFWVFNQIIVPWIIVMLLINGINKRDLFLTYALCLPYAPFPFIGLAPFIVYYAVSSADGEKIFSPKSIIDFHVLRNNIKATFSISNLVIAPIVIGVFLLFFWNPGSLFSIEFVWAPLIRSHNYYESIRNNWTFIQTYLLFCFLEFGVYAVLLWSKFKKEPVFRIAVASLLLIPSFGMGINNDFVMRVSIPALTFLMVYVANFLTGPYQNNSKDHILKFFMIGFLLIGAITPFNEIYRSMDETSKNPQGIINDRWHTLSVIEEFKTGALGVFVVKDPQDTLFFKYLGK